MNEYVDRYLRSALGKDNRPLAEHMTLTLTIAPGVTRVIDVDDPDSGHMDIDAPYLDALANAVSLDERARLIEQKFVEFFGPELIEQKFVEFFGPESGPEMAAMFLRTFAPGSGKDFDQAHPGESI